MKVAVPVSHGRVSPVLDFARHLLLVEYSRGREVARSEVSFETTSPLRRAAYLHQLKVDVLIAGAVSRPLGAALSAAAITVIGLRRGPVEEVLAAFAADSLGNARFRLPGTSVESGDRPTTHHRIRPVASMG